MPLGYTQLEEDFAEDAAAKKAAEDAAKLEVPTTEESEPSEDAEGDDSGDAA